MIEHCGIVFLFGSAAEVLFGKNVIAHLEVGPTERIEIGSVLRIELNGLLNVGERRVAQNTLPLMTKGWGTLNV